ncbi:MAG: cell division protein FtsQ/DivIB [Casimicrobiaceae bacterium]
MWLSAWNDAPILNRIAGLLAFGAFCAIATVAIKWAAARPAFAIQRVVVNGDVKRADPAYIAAAIQQGLRGTFFTIDLATARDALAKVPWLRTIAVRRQWPATLEVNVVEHQPLARWNDTALVNTEGEVFDAEYGEELPDFYGPDGSAAEMTQRYQKFAASLRSPDAEIDTLTRSARGAWDVHLADGLAIALGREHVAERWARWIQVSDRYGTRIAQGGQLAAIDLRYANGFAAQITGMPATTGSTRGVSKKNASTNTPARPPAPAAMQRG